MIMANNNLEKHLNLVITKLVLNQTVISYKHSPEQRYEKKTIRITHNTFKGMLRITWPYNVPQ